MNKYAFCFLKLRADYAIVQVMKLSKKERQSLIKKIIEEKDIGTQFELMSELIKKHIDINQPTLSRDLREMHLIKAPKGLGKFVYQTSSAAPSIDLDEFQSKIKAYVQDVLYSGNIVLLKTPLGESPAVARAIDSAMLESVLGTVAGDDTIILVIDRPSNTKKVAKLIDNARKGIKK